VCFLGELISAILSLLDTLVLDVGTFGTFQVRYILGEWTGHATEDMRIREEGLPRSNHILSHLLQPNNHPHCYVSIPQQKVLIPFQQLEEVEVKDHLRYRVGIGALGRLQALYQSIISPLSF
jgi:hypothetical protein